MGRISRRHVMPAVLPRPAGRLHAALLCSTLVLASALSVQAEIFPRISEAEGTVVERKTGEEAQFVDTPAWRPVDINQDLLAGDTLRTNAAGNLTIRFSDKSLVRMGRNTTMLVKRISATSDSLLELREGAIWARAARGGSKVQVETPAATAAIRGTDWTLQVNGSQTTLTVLEGSVELANAQGSVVVNQGEGAVVSIGSAPRKYILVNLREREQLLLYSELRDVFSGMSPTGMDDRRSRAERRRILATAAASRSAEDWLLLAEASLSIAGRAETRAALSPLKRPLPAELEARARLVEAMLAGQDMNYAEAARLFEQALPRLPRDRKGTAAYGLWFARSLAEPKRAIPPPSAALYADDPAAVLASITAISHLQGEAEALKALQAAEKRFPGDARFPVAIASFALSLDRRDEVKAALARAKAIDPDDPGALLQSARFRDTVSSDVDGALAELQRAAAVAPGDSTVWNEIGLVQFERNAVVEADRAHRRALELNPESAVIRANYARFLMDNDQIATAKAQIDAAEKLDPTSYAVLAAKGRYLLQVGKTAEGEKALLNASAVNPTYGDALIGLAIASYQKYNVDETMQALDNADRFDPVNPTISLIRSGIAVDDFRADEAIVQAREALRRRQLRGGYYAGYDVNRQTSSYLGLTLENIGLQEWGQYYEDRSFDPFKATSYLGEANDGRTSPFVSVPPIGLERFYEGSTYQSAELQSLLFDPLYLASSGRRNSLSRTAFVEASLTGRLIQEGDATGWGTRASLQGTSYAGLPVSYKLEGEIFRPESERANDANDFDGGFFRLGIKPSLTDTVVLFGNRIENQTGYPGQTSDPSLTNRTRSTDLTLGAAWSHTIEERNVLQAFVVRSEVDTRQRLRLTDELGVLYDHDRRFADETWTAGLSHLYGIGPVNLRYGVDMTSARNRFRSAITNVDSGLPDGTLSDSSTTLGSRLYADALYEPTRDLQIQAGLYKVDVDGQSAQWGPIDLRLGAAWAPVDGQWLRAYYRQDTQSVSNYSLSPISTVGLTPMDLPLFWGGRTETVAARWDAEWTDRFFTAAEYQRQRFRGLSLGYDDVAGGLSETRAGTIDRLYFAGNTWIGGGLGSFATLTLNKSRDAKGPWEGRNVPLIPDYAAQVGLKYVHPSRTTVSLVQNFIGQRLGVQAINNNGRPITRRLDSFTTTDAALTWTSPTASLDFNLSVTNIFDERVESAFDIPAPGRTIWASLTRRF